MSIPTLMQHGGTMAKKIKLENIVADGYDRNTGKLTEKVTDEYVCEACRHLVNTSDAFCWQCGSELSLSNLVEHHSNGKKLTDKQFQDRRNKIK